MPFSKKLLSQTVTQLCLIKDINHIVISPGSRNAPLTIGFVASGKFKNYSIVDERSAGFFALGMALKLKKPVALVCTSGSALLNYYPAIAEAYYSDIPLVILSADRPENYIDIGDGQTIRQENVFKNHILYSANCKEGSDNQIFNETEINIALNTAIELRGPVHINLPFSEPLYDTCEELGVRPQHVPSRPFVPDVLQSSLKSFADVWNKSLKKMILIGVMEPNQLNDELLQLLTSDQSVIVLSETTSNLHHPNIFPRIDQLIAPCSFEELRSLKPDVLLTFGGMVVSKKIKAFLRDYSPSYHYHVDPKKAYDTYFVLTEHFKQEPNEFLKTIGEDLIPLSSDYNHKWKLLKEYRLSMHDRYLNNIPHSDMSVYHLIFSNLPKNIELHLSNSTTIRYSQLFEIPEDINIYCNRGTSGIDGTTSTAIGFSVVASKPTLLLTGDLSFFYDSNALWNQYIPKSFKIILVNNEGGGIFRILPKAKESPAFETFFETKHHLNAQQLASMFGFEYTTAKNNEELKENLSKFFENGDRPKILEVSTPSQINDRVLKDYFDFLR